MFSKLTFNEKIFFAFLTFSDRIEVEGILKLKLSTQSSVPLTYSESWTQIQSILGDLFYPFRDMTSDLHNVNGRSRIDSVDSRQDLFGAKMCERVNRQGTDG